MSRNIIERFEEHDDGNLPANSDIQYEPKTDGSPRRFRHERTRTVCRVFKQGDGSWNVQPQMGNSESIVQPNDPGEFIGATASVLAMDIESLAEAKALAYLWIRGWSDRTRHTGDSPGDIRDLGREIREG